MYLSRDLIHHPPYITPAASHNQGTGSPGLHTPTQDVPTYIHMWVEGSLATPLGHLLGPTTAQSLSVVYSSIYLMSLFCRCRGVSGRPSTCSPANDSIGTSY